MEQSPLIHCTFSKNANFTSSVQFQSAETLRILFTWRVFRLAYPNI